MVAMRKGVPTMLGAIGLVALAALAGDRAGFGNLGAASSEVTTASSPLRRVLSTLRLIPAAAPQNAAADPSRRALVDQYCVSCHNDRLKTGGVSLEAADVLDPRRHAELLEKVIWKLRTSQMPPASSRQPEKTAVNEFVATLGASLDRAAAESPNPGRIAAHRLNRSEYVNVIQDLLALEVDGSALLPGDMAGFGFDNNADALNITPALMARYITAATKISRLAVGSPDNRPATQVYKIEFGTRQDARMGEEMPFATHGGMAVRHTFPLDGEYTFGMRLTKNGIVSTIDGIEQYEHPIELRIDYALAKEFKIGGRYKGPDPGVLIAPPEGDSKAQELHEYRVNADKELEVRLPVKAGTRLVSVAFADAMPEPTPSAGRGGRGLGGGLGGGITQPRLEMFYISGPFSGKTPQEAPSRERIFVCHPTNARDEEPCAKKIIATLARRAYRRPVAENDVQPLMALYREGRKERDFDFGIERALEALLSSPRFLIRLEGEPARAGANSRLTDLELASRLSFFLWKTMPDDALLDLAERGSLKDPKVLAEQVRRMLADRRASRSINDFVNQWLTIRNLSSQEPDATLFGGFDSTLREAMLTETQLFFEDQFRDDRPIPELLTANYSFLNERLANHYGIENVYGSHFRRVPLTDERRFGLLGQASILTVTSYPNRTSVVRRGQWILENLLGAAPPPPPPNVPPLKERGAGAAALALRERMEQHRNSPSCSSCHSRMDPLGFALEHYDAVGRWRETDAGAAINSTITLDGAPIETPKAFREALVQGDQLVYTVAEKMLTYALGRGLEYYDQPVVRQLVRDLAQNHNHWSSLMMGIVKSTPFQMRREQNSSQVAPAAKSVAAR